MNNKSSNFYQLIWHTRRLFQQLRETSDQLLTGTGINSSQRAVLEFLIKDGEQTVSSMAKDKNVSRQHIQKVVNVLLEQGLIQAMDNPEHKRSPLMKATANGKKLFQRVAAKESELIKSISGNFTAKDINTSLETLKQIEALLKSKSSKYR